MEVPSGRNETILIVDDDELVLTFTQNLIESLGYRVLSASNGRDALEMLRQSTPIDLLFTDVVMPGAMSGPLLVAEARRLRPELKVLYTSGYPDHRMPDRLPAPALHDMPDPGVDQVGKPYRRSELAVKLRKLLDGDRSEASIIDP
jgi:CheY-like chemotaxis protein